MTSGPTPFAEGKATGSKMELVQPASAAMPNEEDVARVMMAQFYADWFAPGRIAHNGALYWDFVNGSSVWTAQAKRVRALFAPILAEKEHYRVGCEKLSVRLHIAKEERDAMEARALAAEAALASMQQEIDRLEKERDMFRRARNLAESALAAERERCAKVAEGTKSYDDNLQRSAGCATTGQRIAAAIRAQGE